MASEHPINVLYYHHEPPRISNGTKGNTTPSQTIHVAMVIPPTNLSSTPNSYVCWCMKPINYMNYRYINEHQ